MIADSYGRGFMMLFDLFCVFVTEVPSKFLASRDGSGVASGSYMGWIWLDEFRVRAKTTQWKVAEKRSTHSPGLQVEPQHFFAMFSKSE